MQLEVDVSEHYLSKVLSILFQISNWYILNSWWKWHAVGLVKLPVEFPIPLHRRIREMERHHTWNRSNTRGQTIIRTGRDTAVQRVKKTLVRCSHTTEHVPGTSYDKQNMFRCWSSITASSSLTSQVINNLKRENNILEAENEKVKEEVTSLKVTISDLQRDFQRVKGQFDEQDDELSDLIYDTSRGYHFLSAGTPPPQNTVGVLNCLTVMWLHINEGHATVHKNTSQGGEVDAIVASWVVVLITHEALGGCPATGSQWQPTYLQSTESGL